jgi:hypothetical protein
VAAQWVKVSVRPPIFRSGGGALEATLLARALAAKGPVLAALAAHMAGVKSAVEAVWPIGPNRNRPHSVDTFSLATQQRGWLSTVTLKNPADYLHFIHRKGNPGRLVVDEEILPRLVPAPFRAAVAAAVRASMQGGRP